MKDGYEVCDKCNGAGAIKTELAPAESRLSGLLYGVVEWIDGNPILDGMTYFESKENAMTAARDNHSEAAKLGFNVKYTVIRLVRAA